MPTKVKAYSYIRFSTDIQLKGDSLRRQKEASKKYAEEHDLELIEQYEDLGVSGFKGKQSSGALGKFILAVKNNQINAGSYLLVEEFDRLSRQSPIVAQQQFLELINLNIIVVTLADGEVFSRESITEKPQQLFISLIKMMAANDESKKKSERLSATYNNKRKNASTKKLTAICPAWLALDKAIDCFIENDTQVANVREIFKASIAGEGAQRIQKYLNANLDQFPPPKSNGLRGWYKSYIQKILINKAVFGEYQPHKMVDGKRQPTGAPVENYFPVIISKNDFDLSRARQEGRRINGRGRKGAAYSNIFSGILKCGKCGGNVIFENKGKKATEKYLRCLSSKSGLTCNAVAWPYNDFESSFFKFIQEINISDLFNNQANEDLLKREVISDEITVSEAKLISDKNEFSLFISRLGRVPEELFNDFNEKAVVLKNQIKLAESSISALKKDLLILTDANDNFHINIQGLNENIYSYNQIINEKSDNEIKNIRQVIHHEIKKNITKIIINNSSKFMAGDSIQDMEIDLTKTLKKKGYTLSESYDYLLTDTGQRLYDQFTRTYTVIFSNGAKRIVNPETNFNYRIKPSRFSMTL